MLKSKAYWKSAHTLLGCLLVSLSLIGALGYAQVQALGSGQPQLQSVTAAIPTYSGGFAASPQCAGPDTCIIMKKIVNPIITFLAGSVGLIAAIMLVMRGMQYSASEGDPGKRAAARTGIANIVVGLVGFVFLYALLQWLIPGGYFN